MVSLIAEDVRPIWEETQSAAELQSEEIAHLVQAFLLQPITPEATWQFENAVEDRLRELGRSILEVVYNRLEADDPDEMPKQVEYDRQEYSRKNEKTPNRGGISTVFGQIPLYLNNQKAYMDYQEYRRLGLPSGNGITEAACKTVFTQQRTHIGLENRCDTW